MWNENEQTAVPAGCRESRLSLEFDSRLADLWLFLMDRCGHLLDDEAPVIAWFLRMAYLTGYNDALYEPRRGDLYRRLGLPAPPPRKQVSGHGPIKRGPKIAGTRRTGGTR